MPGPYDRNQRGDRYRRLISSFIPPCAVRRHHRVPAQCVGNGLRRIQNFSYTPTRRVVWLLLSHDTDLKGRPGSLEQWPPTAESGGTAAATYVTGVDASGVADAVLLGQRADFLGPQSDLAALAAADWRGTWYLPAAPRRGCVAGCALSGSGARIDGGAGGTNMGDDFTRKPQRPGAGALQRHRCQGTCISPTTWCMPTR